LVVQGHLNIKSQLYSCEFPQSHSPRTGTSWIPKRVLRTPGGSIPQRQ
jgi:hypothetical protein